jgi:hypothetical protein
MDHTYEPPPVPPPVPPPPPPEGDGDARRVGPPWEQPGPWFRRFAETAQAALLQPAEFFSTMRVRGGLGPPIGYGIIGTVTGGVFAAFYQLLFSTYGAGLQGTEAAREQAAIGLLSTGCLTVMLPVFTVVSLFVSAAITHVALLLLDGARRGFEATMRVAAYGSGSTALLNLVPICGGVVGGIWSIVITVIGISRAHEISTGKALAAVLLPMLVCCLLVASAMVAAFLVAGVSIAGLTHQ